MRGTEVCLITSIFYRSVAILEQRRTAAKSKEFGKDNLNTILKASLVLDLT